jgi:hypothetical protein
MGKQQAALYNTQEINDKTKDLRMRNHFLEVDLRSTLFLCSSGTVPSSICSINLIALVSENISCVAVVMYV